MMPNCEVCDQELTKGEFEEKLGICVNCIMIDSRDHSFKSFLLIIMLFLGGSMFIMALISVLFNIPLLFVDFEAYFPFFATLLIITAISGFVVIYFSVVFKFR